MRRFNPKGRRLYALEKNILKYRAFEMVLILFYAEDIKSLARETICATDRFAEELQGGIDERLPVGTKGLYKKLWQILVGEGVLSEAESRELQQLISYRDYIAHRVHQLTADINPDIQLRGYAEFFDSKYNYQARKRLKHFRELLSSRLDCRYIRPISFDALLFDAAEKTYLLELELLRRKIDKQLTIRKERSADVKAELSIKDIGLDNEFDLYHPHNKTRNGRLTKRGIDLCYRLFDHGKSALAVAYLLQLSYQAARKRQRMWEIDRQITA